MDLCDLLPFLREVLLEHKREMLHECFKGEQSISSFFGG